MTEKEKNDLFYVCSLIEYTGRKTKNRRGDIIAALGRDGVDKQFRSAQVNHCLSFEQVSDELIEDYGIKTGDFDTISNCKYKIPGHQDIGKLYSIMTMDCAAPGKEKEEMMKIFQSFISDEISKFYTDLYYQNPDYLECSYREGYLLP